MKIAHLLNQISPGVILYKKLTQRENLYLISIICVAFFLRVWDIGWNGFNGDESIYSGQAASMLGVKEFLDDFSLFRAHPLLLQSLVSIAFAIFGIYDTVARMVPVIFGTLTVFVTYLVAKELFDKKIGLISCLVLALLPFHIVFSRQVLVDIPLSFFVILFLYFIVKYRMTEQNIYSYLTGVSCGLCFISKEVGIITLPIYLVYTFMTHTLKLNKFVVFLSGLFSGIFPYFILILTRQDAMHAFYNYGSFQLSKEITTIFSSRYSSTLINEAFGYVLPILWVVSFILIWKDARHTKSRKYLDGIILLALTLGTLYLFYELLPSKGDRFLITLLPPGVILGCAFLISNSIRSLHSQRLLYLVIVPLIIFSNNFFLSKAFPLDDLRVSDNLGNPWDREVALWIKNNTPADAAVLTPDGKLANIIRFYSNHEVYTIENSENPAYLQVNPALLILNKNVTIIVDDMDDSNTSESLIAEMREYIKFFNPKLIHTVFKHNLGESNDTPSPIIKVYQMS
jgi:4-amino-4-deoxy-L-arabinose transferase-like glycosyltransferase